MQFKIEYTKSLRLAPRYKIFMQFNYAAYLLADENGTSIKVANYRGINRVDLIENNEYGYCSLVKARGCKLNCVK